MDGEIEQQRNILAVRKEHRNIEKYKDTVTQESPMLMIDDARLQWPTVVNCNMNIQVWHDNLKAFDLLDSFGFLLAGFKDGFHQGIPPHTLDDMKWFCPPNHSSAMKVKEKI